ncbi:uncharacterized protein AB9W97_009219 isoform 2-T2 [Spinachia spinachia]
MERYESLGLAGEGSYGTVLKCRHRDSGRLVAVKKFTDSDDDATAKKIALREIKLLRLLRHDNLVNLLEVWKRRRHWYLVFEFVERTLLDELEQNQDGLELNTGRRYLYQVLRAVAFCHQHNIIHRDIKPENILISQGGVVKMCDFGFARTVAPSSDGGVYTDYVATRWYRAPELLVGDSKYGKPVDVWAVGCLLLEMLTGQPLFPGDSDLDQIDHIVRCFGNLTAHHQELFLRNPVFSGVRLPEHSARVQLEQRFHSTAPVAVDLARSCLQMDPERRAQCSELQEHPLFTQDSFHIRFLDELSARIQKDHRQNSTLPKITTTPRWERSEGDDKNRGSKDKKQPIGVDQNVIGESKGMQPLKLSKTVRNATGPLRPTKKDKTGGLKTTTNVAKTAVAMKGKSGKAGGAELRKQPQISELTKTVTSDLLEAARTTTRVKESDPVSAEAEHGKGAAPDRRPHRVKPVEATDDIVSSVIERHVTGIRRSSKYEPSQDFGNSRTTSNSKAPKLSKRSTADRPNKSLSLKPSLKSTSDRKDTQLTQKMDQMFTTENTEASQTFPTTMHRSNMEGGRIGTTEGPKVLPSNRRPPRASSNFGPKLTQNHKSWSNSPSRTLTSDLCRQSSTVCTEANPTDSSVTPPKGTSTSMMYNTVSSSNPKPTNDANGASNKALRGLPTDGDPTEESVATTTLQDGIHTYIKDLKEAHGCLKMGLPPKTTANHSMTMILKTLKVSDKENREDLALIKPLVNHTAKFSGNLNIEQRSHGRKDEPDIKPTKAPHFKSLNKDPKKDQAAMTLKKTILPTDELKTRDNSERDDKTNMSATADSTSFLPTPEPKAPGRSADVHELDFGVRPSSPPPPPPPPPPSSTPLLWPPSSAPLTPAFCVNGDHLSPGADFHSVTHNLWCADHPRPTGGVHGRLSRYVTGPPSAQVPDNSATYEGPPRSDGCNRGNVKKSDVHFPDVRSSVLREVRGREGKHGIGTSKEQRKGKAGVPLSEPQQHRHPSTDP